MSVELLGKSLSDLSIVTMIFRIILSMACGGVIGLERGKANQPAGMRTYMLVSLGSCVVMITGEFLFYKYGAGDPARLGAQVVSGIGFLGAGTIIIQKQFVRGLTTAAGLWATAAIGLVIGGGMYYIGIAGVVLTLAGLELTNLFLRKVGLHSILLIFTTSKKENLGIITNEINSLGHHITSYTTDEEHFGDTKTYHVTMVIKTRKFGEESLLFQFIQSLPDLTINKME